jgi:predicted RNase H-like HicB family nuclease
MRKKHIAKLNVSLPVLIKKEGEVFVAYTPALDISTYGKSESKAKKSFDELVQTYFEEFVDNPRALEEVLESLGWVKHKDNWQPPRVTSIMQDVRVSLAT